MVKFEREDNQDTLKQGLGYGEHLTYNKPQ